MRSTTDDASLRDVDRLLPSDPEPRLEEAVRALRRRLWIERGFFTAALLGLASAWVSLVFFPRVWAVYVDGRPVVAMRDRRQVQALLERVRTEQAPGARFVQQVRVDRADPARVEITDAATAEERLQGVLKLRAERAVITVDGVPAVALPDPPAAEAVLERIKASLAGKLDTLDSPPRFKEQVEVRQELAEQELWGDSETALGVLRGSEVERTHTVGPGDTARTIAHKYQLSVAVLKQLNPGKDLGRLHAGEELRVSQGAAPLLTVVAEGRLTRILPSPFETITRPAPTMYTGKRMVKRPGRPGRQRVVYRVRCENGKVVEREVLRREPLTAAQPQVVVVGLKPRPKGR